MGDKLEKLASAQSSAVDAYEEINNEWGRSLDDAQANLDQFANSMDLVGDASSDIAGLTDALAQLVARKQEIQAEERALFECSKEYQRVTRTGIDEKNIDSID